MSEALKDGAIFVTKSVAKAGVDLIPEGALKTYAAAALDALALCEGDSGLQNPRFVQNGHEDRPSPNTCEYFMVRKGLKLAQIGGSIYGGTAGTLSGIGGSTSDIVGGGVAAYRSYLLWTKINGILTRMPASRQAKAATFNKTGWFSWEQDKKAVSAGGLETRMRQIVRQKQWSAVSTVGGLGFSTGKMIADWCGLDQMTGFFISAGAPLVAKGLDAMFGQDTQTLAQAIHWFAFAENVVARGQGTGPYMRIMATIYDTCLMGAGPTEDMKGLIGEPCGWAVIADLLS